MLTKVEIKQRITLLELRRLTGMSQEQFANYVEIPYTTYRRYEKDSSNMDFSKVNQISRITGVAIEMLEIA